MGDSEVGDGGLRMRSKLGTDVAIQMTLGCQGRLDIKNACVVVHRRIHEDRIEAISGSDGVDRVEQGISGLKGLMADCREFCWCVNLGKCHMECAEVNASDLWKLLQLCKELIPAVNIHSELSRLKILSRDYSCLLLHLYIGHARGDEVEMRDRRYKRCRFLDLIPKFVDGHSMTKAAIFAFALDAFEFAGHRVMTKDVNATLRLTCTAIELRARISPFRAEKVSCEAFKRLPIRRCGEVIRRKWHWNSGKNQGRPDAEVYCQVCP